MVQLLVGVPAAIIYGLIGVICLWLLKRRISPTALIVFVAAGAAADFVILYGLVFADQSNRLNSTAEVLDMFVTACVCALTSSLLAVKLTTRRRRSA